MASPRLMLCGVMSGSGKTTVTCGLLQTLVNRGLRTAAFKCGPDYIDPMFHATVIGAKTGNLDGRSGAPPVSPGQGVGGDGYFHSGGGDGLL